MTETKVRAKYQSYKILLSTLTEEDVSKACSWSDLVRKTNIPVNGSSISKLQKAVAALGFSTAHFHANHPRIYEKIEKECPVCHKPFAALVGHRKEKTTCSHGCSNSYFQSKRSKRLITSGKSTYRRVCFEHHGNKCLICGEDKIVVAHHIDKNRCNQSPDNLVPLCPTHHEYFHSKYRDVYKEQIEEYIKRWRYSNSL